ncbi:MAG: serine/threonine-protein kinase [Pseudomonadota bacterium]
MSPGMQLPPTLGGYRIVGRLSEGGMGAVVLGRKEGARGFEKQAAIKVLLPQFLDSPEVQELFFSEARLAARLTHPNVCQVFDFGEDQGLYYLVMEYLVGDSLTHLVVEQMRRGEHMPLSLAARILTEAARGLHHAHTLCDEQGQPLHVVHRDVSPQNLMITVDGAVKVLDFGIAKSRDRATATQQGILRGKPAYMSPEQARGEPLDARSDIFSLGTVLFELCTHHNPFVRDGVYATIQAIAGERARDPRSLRPELPEAAARIINCALSPDREERFASADVLARALEQLIAHLGHPAGAVDLAAHLQLLFPGPRRSPEQIATVAGRAPDQSTLAAGAYDEQQPTLASDADVRPARGPLAREDEDSTATATAIASSRGAGAGRLLVGAALLLALGVGGVWGLRPGVTADPTDAANAVARDAALAVAPDVGVATAVVDGAPDASAADRAVLARPDPRSRPGKKPPRYPSLKPRPPAEVRPPEIAPVTTYGTLTLPGSTPYFLVYVDGKALGPTPLENVRLPTGEHQLVLTEPGGNRTVFTRSFVIHEGKNTKVNEHIRR